MTAIRVELKDFGKKLKEIQSASIEEMKLGIVNGLYKSIPALVAKSPVDTGQYAQSWDVQHSDTSAVIGNFAPHAPIIEFGARPFTPPLEPLLAWAKRVLNDPSQPPEYSNNVWALARGVQNKIKKVGMKPRHILTDSLETITNNIIKEIERELS